MILPSQTLVSRALNKAERVSDLAKSLLYVFKTEGLTSTYRAYQEHEALISYKWGKLEHHLRTRLNTCSRRYGHGLAKICSFLNCADVRMIGFNEFNYLGSTGKLLELSLPELHSLYTYYRFFGDFRTAYLLRTRLLSKFLVEELSRTIVTKNGLNAALELGKPELILDCLSHCDLSTKHGDYQMEIKAMALAQSGKTKTAEELWASKFSPTDFKFRSLIAGRRVAVVGPAPPINEPGDEIDSFDVVVRTNYRLGSNIPVNGYGSRTDLSYYNHYRMSSRFDEVIAAARGLRWVMLKGSNDQARFMGSIPTSEVSSRTAFLPHPLFFGDAAPMGIQTILNDLIRFSPAQIKLFCTTFCCSTAVYGDHYRFPPLDRSHTSDDLRIHEPYSAFAFVRNLFLRNLCTVDETTSNVISMRGDDYANNIQKLYGDFALN